MPPLRSAESDPTVAPGPIFILTSFAKLILADPSLPSFFTVISLFALPTVREPVIV